MAIKIKNQQLLAKRVEFKTSKGYAEILNLNDTL